MHKLRQWLVDVVLQVLVPNFQEQLVHVQFDGAVLNAPLHNFGGEVVRAVQGHQHTVVDLLVDLGQPLVVELGALRAVVAVDVTDAGGQEVDFGFEEVLYLLGGREKG